MSTVEKFRQLIKIAETKNYYDILRVKRDADPRTIKAAFHNFALVCHPDRAPDADRELIDAAAELFKRGVEAYQVLSNPTLRARYDQGLTKGRIRFDEKKLKSVPPAPKVRGVEDMCVSVKAKAFGVKADRLLALGKLEEARVMVTTAMNYEPNNEELQAKLREIWTKIASEGL
jgi:DnaJ-class molecular chaperone